MDVATRLLESGVIEPAVLQAVNDLVENKGVSYEQALLQNGVPADTVRSALAEEYEVPAFTFDKNFKIDSRLLGFIAEDSARFYRLVPLKIEDNVLIVAANRPYDLKVREVLNFVSTKHNLPYRIVFMLNEEIEMALQAYDSLSGEVDEALFSLGEELEQKIAENKSEQGGASVQEELSHLKEDAPVTKIVATILRYAVDGGASDIHVEPTDHNVQVRFRVDGRLQKSLELPLKVHSAVIARIKILSNMRLDEKRRPQDGRFSATFGTNKIDFRVSVLPTNHGEKAVMRILDNQRGVSNLDDTGISEFHLKTIRRILKEPYGIVLISGPTGSGKSTTLYSMLGEVDRLTKNVLSLEDPVEYNIDGVSQSQVRPEIGYTFATGLRSALRQDPDIIMVGEIRDKETAQLAIQAALTGHLVFSTIHTNNAIGVIPRLIDMGVDPYLIAPTLKIAMAQRLARRICPGTGKEVETEGSIQMMIDKEFESLPTKYHDLIPKSKTMLSPEPSDECPSGTKGRVAVMEVFEVNDEIQDLILKGGSEEEMWEAGRKNGFMSMKEDAIIKALNHIIPYEEVSTFGSQISESPLVEDLEKDLNQEGSVPAVDNVSGIKTEVTPNLVSDVPPVQDIDISDLDAIK